MPTVAPATLHNARQWRAWNINCRCRWCLCLAILISVCLRRTFSVPAACEKKSSTRTHFTAREMKTRPRFFFIWFNNRNKLSGRAYVYVIFLFHFLSYFTGNIVDWRENCASIEGSVRDRFNQDWRLLLKLPFQLAFKLIRGLTRLPNASWLEIYCFSFFVQFHSTKIILNKVYQQNDFI